MILFKNFCFNGSANLIYAKDNAVSLAGENYNYLYNNIPRTKYKLDILCNDYEAKSTLFAWLNKNATTKWGVALPVLNDAKLSNKGYGVDLTQHFLQTLCESPIFELVESNGSAKIVNNFLTFGNSSYAIVRRYVSCILTSDLQFANFGVAGTARLTVELEEVRF